MLKHQDNAVVIIGHGPELYDKGRGRIIDGFEVVVRLGDACQWQYKDELNYGTKTDYYVLPSTQLFRVRCGDLDRMKPSKELWITHNMAKHVRPIVGTNVDKVLEKYKEYNPVIIYEIINFWHDIFQRYNPKQWKFSTGMVAIINAVHRLRPRTLVIPGFDNLKKGTHEDYLTGADKEGVNFTPTFCAEGHDLEAENKLLEDIQEIYGVNII